MNKTLSEIIRKREDLSDYVFHFTKADIAKETLAQILLDRKIKNIKSNGYICFSEAPLTMLADMFAIFKRYKTPLYAPYGIGIKKSDFFRLGGRPVIYGDGNDQKLLPEELLWRFVLLEPDNYDYSWLREWRIEKSEIKIDVDTCIVVVDKESDIVELEEYMLDLVDIDVDATLEDGGVYINHLGYFSRLKCVSMENITTVNNMNKEEFATFLEEQRTEDCYSLGGEWK